MSRKARWVALALPLLAVVAGVVHAEVFLRRAEPFVFEIEGYDPRDVLRGSYLLFRLRVDEAIDDDACREGDERCCLCLTRAGGDATHTRRMECVTAHADCDGVLALRGLREPMRYYVPEAHARRMEERLIDAMQRNRAHALVAVDGEGVPRVLELRVDGEPLWP